MDGARAAVMMEACGLAQEAFFSLYNGGRPELDRGTVDNSEYWTRIMSAGGVRPSKEALERLRREDVLAWTRINPKVVAWSHEARAAGFRTAILSNMHFDALNAISASPEFGWISDFDATVFSCMERLVKPEPGIYLRCLEALGAAATECIFIDDNPGNVAAAVEMGMKGIVFESDEETARQVSRISSVPVSALYGGGAP
jgi:putative hydrolase of the HAD superfamily